MTSTIRHALAGAFVLMLTACGGGGSSPSGTDPADANTKVDPAASTLTGSPLAARADGAAAVTLTATARDKHGSAVSGVVATFAATGAGSRLSPVAATTGRDGTARVTLTSTVAGPVVVSVSIGGVAVAQRATTTFVAGPPAAITFTAQPASGTAGGAFGVAAAVADAYGNPVGQAAVSLSLKGGAADAGLAGATTAVTEASGIASFPGLSIGRAGHGYSIVATSGGAVASSAVFDVRAGAPSPERSSLAASPAVLVAGGTPSTVSVVVLDALDNPVPDALVELLSSAAGDATTTGVTAADGVASATVGGTAAGDRTVTAFAGGVPLAQTATVTVVPAAPDAGTSSVVGPVGPVVADGSSVDLRFTIRDVYGNPVPGLALSFSASGGAVSAASGMTDGAGEGSVLVRSTIAGSARVSIAFEGGVLDVAVTFVAGPAASLELAGAPTSVTAGTGISATLTALDAHGNVATAYRGTVHLAATDAAAVLPADLVFAAADAGRRTIGLELRTAAAQRLTVADVAAPALTAEATITVTAGSPDPAGSSLAASPTSAPADGTLLTLTAAVGDRFGNPVAGATVSFTSTGEASFSPPTTVTGVDGTAATTVSALAAGPQTLLALIGATQLAARDVSFTAAPASPTTSVVEVAPATIPADGTTAAAATVTVKDALGRPVAGASVALACSVPATILPETATSDEAGRATFTVSSIAVGSGTLTATVGSGSAGVVIAQQPAIDFTPAVHVTPCTGNLVFGTPVSPIGSSATKVESADLDGDGRPDLVIRTSSLSVYKGLGDGRFAYAYDVGASGDFALADVTGDGRADLLVAVSGNNVNVYVNGGARLASSPVVVPIGGVTDRLAVGDLTGDGRPDLVTLDWAGAVVRTFANTGAVGAVGFTPRSTQTISSRPLFAAIADLNGDGRGDVVFTQESYLPNTSHALGVMLGAGDGSVLPPTYTTLSSRPWLVRVADVDGDGRSDVLVEFSNAISVFRNLGAAAYPAPVQLGTAVSTPDLGNSGDFRLADLDGDGHLDLVVAGSSSRRLLTLRNGGAGSFGPVQGYPAGQGPYATATGVVVGDWDLDGHLDAAVIDNANPYLYSYMGLGDGTFPPRIDVGTATGPMRLLAADVDTDQDLDLVTIGYNYGDVTVVRQSAPGSFSPSTTSLGGRYPRPAALTDLNGDGIPDLVVAHVFDSQVAVLLGTGAGGFGTRKTYAVGASPEALAVGDLDGDLDLDAVVVSSSGQRLDLLLGAGDGTFTAGTSIALPAAGYDVAVGDVDGDGVADIVVALSTSGVRVYRGTGGGTFASPVSLAAVSTSKVLLADLTGDGRPELIALHTSYPTGVGVSINDGAGSFRPENVYATGGSRPADVAAADLDGDGDLDLAVSDEGSSNKGFLVATLRNVGGGALEGARLWQTGQSPSGIVAVDLDRDGQVDLATANYTSNTVSILRGVCR
jgi:hypothetical protein